MNTVLDGIIIGGAGGAIAGVTIWGIQAIHDKFTQYIDSNQIYTWLNNVTKDEEGKRFRSTRAIASWNNLTEDRVRQICSKDKRIFLSTGEKENIWGIHQREPETNIHIG